MGIFLTRFCALAVVGLMVGGGLLAFIAPQNVQAVSGRDDINFVSLSSGNVSSYAPGDLNRMPYYYVNNIRPDSPYTLYNVTSRIEGVMDVQDPFIWKTRDCTQKINISRSNGYSYSGFAFDVGETVVVGKYTLTIWTTYDYYSTGDNRYYHNEEMDALTIEIRSLLSPPTTVSHYYDSTSIPPSTDSRLYAGEKFQKMGFSAPTSSMLSGRAIDGNRVQATLVDRSGVDYSGMDWSERAATSANITQYSYFFFRLTIDQSKKAGRYDYTLEFKYTRRDALTGNEPVVIRESSVISLMIDFTPMMEIFSGATYTMAQGTRQLPLTVMLRNTGNCDLARLNVWLDADSYFTIHGGAFYDGQGYKSSAGTTTYIDELAKGIQKPVYFLLDSVEHVPAGEHRLPVRYTGYCYDDGSYTYSDWKATSDSDYSSIRGESLFVTVNVSDPSLDVTAEVTASFNPTSQFRDVVIPVTIMNREAVGYGDVTLRLATFPMTSPSNVVFVNPLRPASRGLEDVAILSLPASSSAFVHFRGDLSPSARPGSYDVELNFTATDLNTGIVVSKTLVVSVRVNPGPPEMEISASYEQVSVRPGKEFLLDIRLENTGQDTARDVSVELLFIDGGSSGYIVSGDRADAYTIEGMLNPFSVGASKFAMGDVPAGSVLGYNFTVATDRNMARSRAYPIAIGVTYTDADGVVHNATTDVFVSALGSPPARSAAADPLAGQITSGAILIVLVWVLFLVGAIIVKKTGGPRTGRVLDAATEARPAQSPPQQQYFQPPQAPTPAPAPSPPRPMEGPSPCRRCGTPVPSGNYICPNCGNPV